MRRPVYELYVIDIWCLQRVDAKPIETGSFHRLLHQQVLNLTSEVSSVNVICHHHRAVSAVAVYLADVSALTVGKT